MPTFKYEVLYTLICDQKKTTVTKSEWRQNMIKNISDFDYEEEIYSTFGCDSIKLEYIAVAILNISKCEKKVEKEDFCIIM